MEFELCYAAVTYLEDGFSASVEVRDLRKQDKSFFNTKQELEDAIKKGTVELTGISQKMFFRNQKDCKVFFLPFHFFSN